MVGPLITNNKNLNEKESLIYKSLLDSINPNTSKLPFDQQMNSVVGLTITNNTQSESIVNMIRLNEAKRGTSHNIYKQEGQVSIVVSNRQANMLPQIYEPGLKLSIGVN